MNAINNTNDSNKKNSTSMAVKPSIINNSTASTSKKPVVEINPSPIIEKGTFP